MLFAIEEFDVFERMMAKKKENPMKENLGRKAGVFQRHVSSLKTGDKMPSFEALNQDGEIVSSDYFQGKKLIVFFYNKDNTPTCTAQACGMQENFIKLKQKGFEVVGISADSPASHKKFAEKYQLKYDLLSDPDLKIAHAFDVWGKKLFMGRIFDAVIRSTFVIDNNSIIQQAIGDLELRHHLQQISNL